ncbi:MAG TPA: 16S rRNA (cytosine(1402)-N(4))-methyltransferase RsmH [Candidatus Bathyarchaeia archaeon]|nr:16S rRNA (cytosine(1402)-N(4))-methyltransferase RsmH [Candidatus Bathyarchaeia archaeon]
MEKHHKPVLLKEVLKFLEVERGEKYLDATIGEGGHTEAILKAGGIVLGIDQDPEAIVRTKKRLKLACPDINRSVDDSPSASGWKIAQGNFANLEKIAKEHGFEKIRGALFDLGIASFQLAEAGRGFSFQADGPLDMRLDPSLGVTAADLINSLSKGNLYELFKKMADEQLAWPIADALVSARCLKSIRKTGQLADLIVKVYRRKNKKTKIHPATKVFQALRIAVNSELENLSKGLPGAEKILKPDGRLVVISFHSGEDRIVKNFFKDRARKGRLRVLTRKPVRPSQDEVESNPLSRSARLRAGVKI